jgi:uncharacterized membrane protein
MPWFRRRPDSAPTVPPVIRSNISSVAQLDEEFARRRSTLDRVSDAITGFVGSIEFVLAHAAVLLAWVLLNASWALGEHAFDPYPYQFLNLVLAVEAVLLGTFVLMSQNRQSRQAEQRAHLDLQVSLLAEQETTKTLQMLQRISERLGLQEVARDKELKQMIETTHVEELAHELQKAREEEPPSE